MNDGQLTMTPALPSAPGRPREPGLPYKKAHETEGNQKKNLNLIRQSLLKHGTTPLGGDTDTNQAKTLHPNPKG